MSKMKRQNITIEQEVYEKFVEIANEKGIKLSPWVNSKMKEFIEQDNVKFMNAPYLDGDYQYFIDDKNIKWKRKFDSKEYSKHGEWEKA